MKNRIDEKAGEIEEYLLVLYSFFPKDLEEYERDEKTKAACEHYFEKIIEALADLGFLVIKDKKFREPKDDIDAFVVLAESGLISEKLLDKLRDAKGMRNIIAHEYGKVDDVRVFEALTNELDGDVREFLESLK